MTRGELRRQEIVDAAFDLFAEQGYHATGIADIAKRLRMSHGTFYRYFESKRDILDHVVEEVTRRIGTALVAENAPGRAETLAEYREQVRRIVRSLSAVVDADPRIARVLLLEATGIDDELTAHVLGLLDSLTETTRRYLDNGVERGFLRSDLDTQATARALNGLILAGVVGAIRADRDALDRDRIVDAGVRLMFDGIAAAGVRSEEA